MPSVWLPGEVVGGLIQEREGVAEAKRTFGEFHRRLKAIDSRLFLFLCDREDPDNELRYGFYYIGRRNEDGTQTLWEIRHRDGSFREPDERVIEAFQHGDANRLRSPGWEREKNRRKQELERERRKRFLSEERQAQLLELADFKWRVQVPVPDSVERIKEN